MKTLMVAVLLGCGGDAGVPDCLSAPAPGDPIRSGASDGDHGESPGREGRTDGVRGAVHQAGFPEPARKALMQGEPASADEEVIRDVFRSPHGDREYRLFLPSREDRAQPVPLIVLLHGCTQDAEDVARGTRMDLRAGERGAAVLYPSQDPEAHPMRCWNWYEPDHQTPTRGEPALLAAMIEDVVEARGLDPERIFLAGISAGGAMALVLAATHPELARAVASHSGVPFGVARSVAEATAAMGGDGIPGGGELAESVLDAMDSGRGATGAARSPVPLLVIHGKDDPVVALRNAQAVEDQWSELITKLEGSPPVRSVRPVPNGAGWEGTVVRLRDARGTVRFEARRVSGLGHAWSGGSPDGTFTQPGGLDASRTVVEFFLDGPGSSPREGRTGSSR